MTIMEGEGKRDKWPALRIGVKRWFVLESSTGVVAVILPRSAVGTNITEKTKSSGKNRKLFGGRYPQPHSASYHT